MSTIEIFLNLIRIALWQTPERLPEKLSERMTLNVMRGAQEQAVIGLVLGTLIRQQVSIPELQHLQCMAMLNGVKQNHENLNDGLRRLKELLDERGIDYVIVKGQAVAAYYPTPEIRQGGDIDYYCDERNFPKALEAVREEWGIEADANGSLYHIHYDYEGVIYEAHFALTQFYDKKKDAYWKRIVDEDKGCTVTVDGIAVNTLSPTLHTLYVFIHLFQHLLGLGVGYRQLCDLAVMLHACRQEIDYQRMNEILEELGLVRAYKCIGSILIDNIGMPAEDLGYELTKKDRRYTQRIVDIMMYRGNMGKYNKISGFNGWKHNIEAAAIKLSHFVKLRKLAPAYSRKWIVHELTKKFF